MIQFLRTNQQVSRVLVVFCMVVGLAPTASAEGRIYSLSLATAITAHGADLATTTYCLGAHTCREGNPFLEPFSRNPLAFGVVKMGGAALQLWAISRIENKKVATIANFVVTGVFTGIAIRNARLH